MSQHFLLSAKARTLSLARVMRLSDAEAYLTFKQVRWPEGIHCPRCGSVAAYEYASRPIFKCKDCSAQFSVTTGTIFASRKLKHRDILAAIAIFVNGAKGISALQLSRDLDVQYKTAFVLAHKIREAMGAGSKGRKLSGHVEIDGAYFGGHIRPENRKEDRRDRRLAENQTGKRRAVVVMRERDGNTLTTVCEREDDAVPVVAANIAHGSTVYADEAPGWDVLHATFATRRVNHSIAFLDDGVCTNQAESFFSRLRRMEIGTHHHISGKYLGSYANEAAWREDNRRVPNGTLYALAAKAAMSHPISRTWKGYWQRPVGGGRS
jgi:transposase-like protein